MFHNPFNYCYLTKGYNSALAKGITHERKISKSLNFVIFNGFRCDCVRFELIRYWYTRQRKKHPYRSRDAKNIHKRFFFSIVVFLIQ